MTKTVLIFGREPAAWVGLIEGALVLGMAFGLGFSSGQTALIIAVITAAFGVFTAYVTKDTMLGVIVGLSKSVLALLVGFGVDVSDQMSAAIIGFVVIAVGFMQRAETSPIDVPTFKTARNAHT